MKNWIFRFIILVILVLISPSQNLYAQQRVVVEGDKLPELTDQMKNEIVDSIAVLMSNNYVYPEIGKQIADYLKKQLKNKQYIEFKDVTEFSQKLSEDILSINNDRHLGVRFDPEMERMLNNVNPDEENDSLFFLDAKRRNFGFKKLEILQGNIGYLDLRGFTPTNIAGKTAEAAMAYLEHTNAIIFDLRQNGGGSPSMIQLILSYFFEERTLFNRFYFRPDDTIIQWYTLPYVNGNKMPDKPIYILTSKYTFSAAEEFTYNLKHMERATIIGETTGGGAHPVNAFPAGHGFITRVSIGRAINPVTQTNWEGTGITPHIETIAANALDVAHLDALNKIIVQESDPEQKMAINWVIDGINASLNPVILSEVLLKKYAGQYGPRKITFENEDLYYQRDNNPKFKMTPISENMFMLADLDYFRLKFEINDQGEAVKVIGLYENGRTDSNEKD